MKTKTLKLMLVALGVLLSLNANAYDVQIDGIYYNLLSDAKAAVTSGDNKYTGDITIPSSFDYNGTTYNVTSIRASAFDDCSGLISVNIPSSVTTIGDYAFRGCSRLTSVHISDLAAWCNIKISNIALSGAHRLYLNGEEVTDLTIPDGVTSIGASAFRGYSCLTSVSIPNSVTSIGYCAFAECSNLRKIVINSAPIIGGDAFKDNDRISFIYINSKEAPYLNNKTFTDDVYKYAYVHTPMGYKEEIATAYGWRDFEHFKEDMDINGETYYASLRVKQGDLGYVDQYIKVEENYTLYIGNESRRRINTIMFNGEDVTDKVVDGYYTTPTIMGNSVLSISYEDNETGVSSVVPDDLKVYGNGEKLFIKNAGKNAEVTVYTIDGKVVYANIIDDEAVISLPSALYVVKVNERTTKVAL